MGSTQQFAIDVELPIARPPDFVWAALTDWEAAGAWFRSGIERVEPPPDGTRNLTMVSFHFGSEVEERSIQNCKPPEHLDLVWAERSVMVVHSYTLRRLDDGNTAVRLRVTVGSDGLGVLWRRRIEKRVVAADREQLDRFKACVEAR
ncbi:SRPBCC family protein [Enhygromyxa salina]|nr:SRPBCC family protein [Enhygromyxa salina]